MTARRGGLVEGLVGLLALLAYALAVSRGEFLPWDGPPRALAAPMVLVLALGLGVWRWRDRLVAPWTGRALVPWVLGAVVALPAVGLRWLIVPPARPLAPAETAILTAAAQLTRLEAAAPLRPSEAALAWLHVASTAYAYMAGVSAGTWQVLKAVSAADVAPVARLLHLAVGLATIGLSASVGLRLSGRAGGWLSALLLTSSGPAIVAAGTVEWSGPAGLVVAAVAWLASLAPGPRRSAWASRFGPRTLTVVAACGLALLWWPTWLGVAVVPLAAIVTATAVAGLWRRRWPVPVADGGNA